MVPPGSWDDTRCDGDVTGRDEPVPHDTICTIVARNYVAQARVLAASVAEHVPTARIATLVVDGEDPDRDLSGLGQVLLPEDLGLDVEVLRTMQLTYGVMEFATALKPATLLHLLRGGARTATYLDPDIRLYGGIDDVLEAAAEAGVVVTPHTVEPLPRDGRMPDEAVIMHAGMYNLGFVASGGRGVRFLAWWHDRLRTDAVVDIPNALFTDQRWVDWAPALAEPRVMHDKGLNAAYWNLHERPVAEDGEGWTVGGRPLRFFHFSGYDPERPWLLSTHQGPLPRGLLSENPALRRLCREYGADLLAAGHAEMRRRAYRHDVLPSGLRLTSQTRRLCRDAVLGVDPALSPPPDPWADEPAFLAWLTDDVLGHAPWTFSRLDYSQWRVRSDLHVAFPDPLVADARAYRLWLDGEDTAACYAASGLPPRPRSAPAAASRARSLGGWSIVGYARAELGVGEAGRRLATAVAAAGVPWEMVGLTSGSLSRQQHAYRGRIATSPGYGNVVLCVNADQTPRVSRALGDPAPHGRRVGYWFWELEDFPRSHLPALEHVDEVWVSSEFNRACVAAVTDLPVTVVPPPLPATQPPSRFTREQLGLPEDRTVFLVNFDYLSVLARKNPLGAVEAYLRAFGPDDGTVLVVKSINGHLRLGDRERVRDACAGRPDVILREDYLPAAQVQALSVLADCVVSLHRSEGFGLNLADAMAAGTPVVATGYSGNMQFMDEESALLVPWTRTEVGPGSYPYAEDATWAEPDLDAAAARLRVVTDSPERTAAVVAAARQKVEALKVERVAAQVRDLLLPDLDTSTLAAALRATASAGSRAPDRPHRPPSPGRAHLSSAEARA